MPDLWGSLDLVFLDNAAGESCSHQELRLSKTFSSETTFAQTVIWNAVSVHTVHCFKDDDLGKRELEKCFDFICYSAAAVCQDRQMKMSVLLGGQ